MDDGNAMYFGNTILWKVKSGLKGFIFTINDLDTILEMI